MASSTEGVIDWNKPSDTDVVDPSLYRGMTLSSFTSFSMSPEPRVTFNIAFPSRTLSALTQTRYFLIHILNSNRVAAMIAHSFAKGSANEADPESGGRKGWPPQAALDKLRESLKTFDIIDHDVKPGLEGKHRRKRKVRLPLIDCEYATKSILECQVLGESDRSGGGLIRIGDHVLVVAKVTRILENGDPAKISQNHTFTPGPGLGYCDGDYITSGPIPQQIPLKALKSLTGHLDGKSVEPDVREDDTTAGKAALNQ
ncbi:hypothetical protein WAI453_001143 [Rhynchosporium graminicola]|uniref:Flavin reductase like domain-containing protein n=1 Tax=Rhynchosporium graminicola TaxID=2792576 RepID=A0A1E1K6M6_9HELO|nr:uncharacterized protein RCO7_09489 [Rhynchosporium commune]